MDIPDNRNAKNTISGKHESPSCRQPKLRDEPMDQHPTNLLTLHHHSLKPEPFVPELCLKMSVVAILAILSNVESITYMFSICG